MCAVLLVAAVAERLHNAWVAPVLSGYDAFGHFTYIWFVAKTGQLPMATHGWSFFHAPLYYAWMAAVWDALASLDPFTRLRIGKVVIAALGCIQAPIAWVVVGRAFPGNPAVRAMAAVFVLAVPVQLYSTGFMGNEGLHAVFGSFSLLALLQLLERPDARRAVVLGVGLGLAMLAKFSALAIVAGSLAAIVLDAVTNRRRAHGAKSLSESLRLVAITAATALVLCGPWILRNVAAYGTPFELSRKTFPVAYVENNQPQAARGWADYLTFDPVIFRRPVWPRDSTPSSDPAPHGFERAVRESVFTGMYANTWFDGFGGWVLPPVVESEASRRAGQALLTLGLVPTLVMIVGFLRAVGRIRRGERDDATIAFACVTAAMIALLVQGTMEVPIAAAVKATYFTPIAVCFAYWFAHGFVWLEENVRALSHLVALAFVALFSLALVVFWQGLVFDPTTITSTIPRFDDGRRVQDGIVKYAGGRVNDAWALFREAAASDYHLAIENLGFLTIDEDRPHAGLLLLRRAGRLQRKQLDAPIGARHFRRLAEAEYQHSIAVVLHDLGQPRNANAQWVRALRRNPEHAEAFASLTLSRLEEAIHRTKDDPIARRRALDYANTEFAIVRGLDPGFAEGWILGAAVHAARGDCDRARRLVDAWHARPFWVQRRFPAETGNGAGHSASIGRRRMIKPRAAWFDPDAELRRCEIARSEISPR